MVSTFVRVLNPLRKDDILYELGFAVDDEIQVEYLEQSV